MKQRKGAFTLVELIVVITILAILATIGFISFQGYTLSSRNSVRISDVKTISKALEFFKLQEGYFPDPTDYNEITFSGALAWRQGTYGTGTHATVARMSEIPTDPLTGNDYAYAVTNSREEYEIGAILEGGGAIAGNFTNQAHANNEYSSYVYGNYNGVINSVFIGDSIYLLGVPTLITTSDSDITVQDIYTQQAFAVSRGKNLPSSYANSLPVGQSHTGATSFTSTVDPVLFSGSVQDLSGVSGKRDLGETIHTYYASSNISGEDKYAEVASLEDDAEYISYVNTLITAEIAGLNEDKITLSNPNSYVSPPTPSCHNPANIGTVGTEGECNGLLIVDRATIDTIILTGGSIDVGGTIYDFELPNGLYTGQVTDFSNLFQGDTAFNDDISYWDTRSATTMRFMFDGASSFNQNLNSWNVGNVTDIVAMFRGASSFNQPLGNWDTSSLRGMGSSFAGATNFNQPLNSWDTSSFTGSEAINFAFMNSAFNQPLDSWDLSGATDFVNLFHGTPFNQDVSMWDTSNVTRMTGVFAGNTAFTHSINAWDTSNVTSFYRMFFNSTYNQDLSGLETQSANNMREMFSGNPNFNQDISSWDVSSVGNMYNMFTNAAAFNQDISSWDVSSATEMRRMFQGASAFDQDISGWSVAGVTNCQSFSNSTSASWISAEKPNFTSCTP